MKHSFSDAGDLRKYFAAIPNIVLTLGLSPYELALYVHFKQSAGDGGTCWKSRATIAKETGMCASMVTRARQSLERPREELKGQPLIVVDEKPNKAGGKPFCSVTIVDIWPLNMSEQRHVIPLDRHTVPLATSPHTHKEKPIKKNTEEDRVGAKSAPVSIEPKPAGGEAHQRLMSFHAGKIQGPIPDGSAQGGAIKWLLETYSPETCERCYESLLGDKWRSRVTWLTVKSEIGAWLVRKRDQEEDRTTQAMREMGIEWSPRPITCPEDYAAMSGAPPLEEVRRKWYHTEDGKPPPDERKELR